MKCRLTDSFLLVGFILTLAAGAALVVACQHQTPQSIKLTEIELKDLVISLERTTCYGNCPAYKVTIYGDGRVEYEGGQNVLVTNKKDSRLKAGALQEIISAFDKANYFSTNSYTYKNCTCTFCTDMPTTTTEFRAKGKSHRVEHYIGCRCAPKELWELEDSLDRIVGTEQWTGDVSKQGPRGTTCVNRGNR